MGAGARAAHAHWRQSLSLPKPERLRTPTSNWAILAALKRMRYSGRMTGHGFRSLAMGVLKERLGYRHVVVDRQLAHLSGDIYGEAYDRALFLQERKVMMQEYADYLDEVASGKVRLAVRSSTRLRFRPQLGRPARVMFEFFPGVQSACCAGSPRPTKFQNYLHKYALNRDETST